ncbi:MAG: ABC transporter substrate-binding protein [Desulfobacterales bacterium]|nr:ABC transporter substrate-binding protein [Desulfobacterales bacterium]
MKRLKKFSFSLVLGILTLAFFCTGAWAEEVTIGFTGPLSGPGSGYGRDNANGLEMAVKDINKAGGITIDGTNYTFNLKTYDDMIDPTAAVNNARRLRARDGARVIFNPVFNTIAPLMEINEQPGSKFLMMAYSSTPKIDELDNELTASIPPPFTAYVRAFADIAWEKGWRKCGMLVTLGAYGDEWRHAWKHHWESLGGEITADKPANYYTETDYSAQLSAVLATNPDFLLIGGPSEPTGLVIEQARNLGFEGGFVLVDQAKMDYIADVVFDGDLSLMNDVVGIAQVLDVPTPAVKDFNKRYEEKFGVHNTFEAMLNYSALNIVFDAMKEAGTVTDPAAIKAAMPEVLPQSAENVPTPYLGILETKLLVPATTGVIKDGEYAEAYQYLWWPEDEDAFEKYKKMAPSGIETRWLPLEGYTTD